MKFDVNEGHGMIFSLESEFTLATNTELDAILQAVTKTKAHLANKQIQDTQDSKKYIEPIVLEIDKKIKQNQKIVDRVREQYDLLGKLSMGEMAIPSWYTGQVTSLLEEILGEKK